MSGICHFSRRGAMVTIDLANSWFLLPFLSIFPLHLKIERYGMRGLMSLLLRLIFFSQFFHKKTEPFGFGARDLVLIAEIEIIPEPLFIVIVLGESDAIFLEDDQISTKNWYWH